MKTSRIVLIIALTICLILIFNEPALAAPGGAIAKGLFKSFWGKVILSILVIIFLPVILYIKLREYVEVRRNKKILTKMSMKNKDFRWMEIQKNVKNVYQRVHVAWDKENMEGVSEYVTHWYWQNQQLVFLDEWKRGGLKNVCRIKSYDSVKPLHLNLSENENFLGTQIAFCISAEMEDYLIEKETGSVVEGKTGYQNVEKIWVMEYTETGWKLDNIYEGSLSLSFAKTANEVPESVKATLGLG